MVRLSTHEMEETISIMVKSSQHTTPVEFVKPSWWPVKYKFPLKRHPGMKLDKWRKILHNLISTCYQLNNRSTRTNTTKPQKYISYNFRRNSSESSTSGTSTISNSNGRVTKPKFLEHKPNTIGNRRLRRDSTGSSAGSTVSSISGGRVPLEKATTPTSIGRNNTVLCSGLLRSSSGDSIASRSEISVAEMLANNLGLSQKSPVVQVYDVCKVKLDNNNSKLRNDICDAVERDINVGKNDFMSYFGLDKKPANDILLPKKDSSQNTVKLFTNKNNLVNCPHVPFSSNIGLKLIKDWHNYDNDVIEKRLERLERYLCNNDLPTLLSPIKEDFKVVNSKNSNLRSRFEHFYVFPTKRRHRNGKLTPKARFLLEKYCKPCFVNLSSSGDAKIKKYLDNRKFNVIAFIDLTKSKKQVKEKENKTPFTLLESRVVLTPIEKFQNNSLTSSFAKKLDSTNLALNTLSQRNENLHAGGSKSNFMNPSVVLQPINHELFEFTKRDRILHADHKIVRPPYKVVKTRVNVYNPRKFSTRQHEVINV